MAQQVRPWLMKPENGRAPTSAGKQTGVSQQNPSGTAACGPQQKSGRTAAIESCSPPHAKRKPRKAGGVHVEPFTRAGADIPLRIVQSGRPRLVHYHREASEFP